MRGVWQNQAMPTAGLEPATPSLRGSDPTTPRFRSAPGFADGYSASDERFIPHLFRIERTNRHAGLMISSTADGGRPCDDAASAQTHEPTITASASGQPGWVLHPVNRRGDERSGAEQLGDDEQGEREAAGRRFAVRGLGLGFGFHFVSVDRFRHTRRHAFCVNAVWSSRVPVAPVEAPGSPPGPYGVLHEGAAVPGAKIQRVATPLARHEG